jgi:hypothetical protein
VKEQMAELMCNAKPKTVSRLIHAHGNDWYGPIVDFDPHAEGISVFEYWQC